MSAIGSVDQRRGHEAPRMLTSPRVRRKLIGFLAAASVLLLGVITLSQLPSPRASQPQGSGGAAPAITGASPINGRRVTLAQLAGKPVVISVWASWCPDCNKEAPTLTRFAAAHPQVAVLGIDLSDTAEGARAFYRKWHVHFPSIADPQGSLSSKLGVRAVPTTIFLDSRHDIVGRLIGTASAESYAAGLASIERAAR